MEVKRFSNQNTKLTEEIKKLKTYMQKLQNEQFEIEKWKQDQYQHNLNIQVCCNFMKVLYNKVEILKLVL